MMYQNLQNGSYGSWEALKDSLQGWAPEIQNEVLDAVRNREPYEHHERVTDEAGNTREYHIRCWKGYGCEFFLAAGTSYRSASGEVVSNFTDLDLEFVA